MDGSEVGPAPTGRTGVASAAVGSGVFGDVVVSIEVGDALALHADVLVLKHAQALYGVDRAFILSLRSPAAQAVEAQLPAPGDFVLCQTDGATAAPAVLFLGTPPLHAFGYTEIRDFGRRSLSVTAQQLQRARHVALTVHGPGFGLDEEESFESLVAGLVEAIRSDARPALLEQVTIVERDPGRAERLEQVMDRLLPGGIVGPPRDHEVTDSSIGPSAEDVFENAGKASDEKGHVFVAMPFSPEFDDVFRYGIQSVVRSAGLLCERVDEASFSGEIMARIRDRIRTAVLVIADLSMANPNVYLEVGFAWGCDVPTILLVGNPEDLKFDTMGYRCLFYSSIHELETKLTKDLPAILGPATNST